MTKLIMLVGLPASGKSEKAKEIAIMENALILSSDELRIELYGDVNHQDDNGKLFVELYRRARKYLESGQSIIIDATNINSKRRILALKDFNKYNKEVYYFNTDVGVCISQDSQRSRTVGADVIVRMYKSLQVPSYAEKWDKIHVVSSAQQNTTGTELKYIRNQIEDAILNGCSYDYLFNHLLSNYDIFNGITDLPQDSKYHSLSVSRHTYYVWEHVWQNYHEEDQLIMMWAAILHDTGKSYCKNFKDSSRYANFISHENASAQLSLNFLNWLGYDDDFVLKVVELVQLHMRLLSISDNESAQNKLKSFVGEDVFEKLQILREADEQAK